jgi:hypothetical protein
MFRRAAALGRRQQLLRLVLRGGSVGSGAAAPRDASWWCLLHAARLGTAARW